MPARAPTSRFFAAALLALTAALAAFPAAAQRVGVSAAVNTDANGLPPGGTVRRLVIGQDVVHNERITTDAKGQTQILFVDGSSVSIGPNADLLIDEFVYDPATGTGKMTLTAIQGAMRFVGGKLSKQENAVTLHLGTATIGVRGGVFVANVQPGGKTEIVFVYGKAVSVSGQSGCSQQLYRPGFAVDIDKPGGCPGAPYQAPPGTTVAILAQLDGRAGGNGGASTVPTDATVANSAVPNTVSNNITTSVQQAVQNTPPAAPPPAPSVTPPQVPTNQIQTTSSQTQPFVANQTPPKPPTVPFPNTTGIAGGFNVLGSGDPSLGFPNPITPYSGASVQNGVLVITVGTASASIPLAQGTTTVNGTGTFSPVGPLSGTTFATPDNTFFYANLAPTNAPSNTILAFGGTPVNPSVYQATGSPQFLAFALQPDAVLQSPFPFVNDTTTGPVAGAVVSPLYLAVSPVTGFGTGTVSGSAFPKALQASMAIVGQGASQASILTVAVGNAFSVMGNPGQTTAQPVLNGIAEGSYQVSGTTPTTLVNTAYLTAIDPNGNSFYGNNSISGFVLDPNNCCGPGQIPGQASATNTLTGQTTNYNFNIPAVATTLPAVGSGPQTTQSLTGYAGGIMSGIVNGSAVPYAFTGATTIQTDATNLQIAAQIAGTDPFTPGTSGVTSLALSFGSLQPGGTNARQGYINDNLFGTLESPGGAGSSLNGNGGTAQLYLVNANAVPGAIASILPSGVSVCACQYLQWGYWGGQLTTFGGDSTRTDVGSINTWVAGMPTVTMPTTGSGSYSGAAIGTVNNAGATYVAAGGFSNTYNFGTNTGSVAISNFDGHNFSGTVIGSGATYAGPISGGGDNRQGTLAGTFYGPGAAETGGNFAVQATSGPSYVASGVFAGKLTGPIH